MGEKIGKRYGFFALVLLCLFIIEGIIILNVFSFSGIRSSLITQVKEKNLAEAARASSALEGYIQQVRDELMTLTKLPPQAGLSIEKCRKEVSSVHQKISGITDALLLANGNGDIIACSSPSLSYFEGLNIKNKDYFSIPSETNETHTSFVNFGQKGIVIISAPLSENAFYGNSGAGQRGVLMSVIDINKLFNEFFHPIVAQESIFLWVDPSTNETILQSPGTSFSKEVRQLYLPLERVFSTTVSLKNIGQAAVTSSDHYIGSQKWRLLIFTPLKSIGRELVAVQQRNLFSLGFVSIIIIALSYFLISIYKTKEDVQHQLEKVNITLEKLGIKVDVEEERFSQADIALEPGRLYLIEESDENHAHEIFLSTLNRGFAGLGLIREDPAAFRARYNLEKTPLIWMTRHPRKGCICESRLEPLQAIIAEFINNSQKAAVLIDRLDYLSAMYPVEVLVRWLSEMKDLAATGQAVVICSVNPDALDEKKLKNLAAVTSDPLGAFTASNIHLDEMEKKILDSINSFNIQNRLISFKDITGILNVTKPTTRAKLAKLAAKGLIRIEKTGRTKSIKITSAGRRLIRSR
ncbi:DUF835 domain-containing protein [Candidatus Woesearchaeota archaeon]|nr:DUF835 domain-containing protein [Candidatus Woesearchaeota archaeon]